MKTLSSGLLVCGPSRLLSFVLDFTLLAAQEPSHSRRAHAPTRQLAGNLSSRERRAHMKLTNDQNGGKTISSQLLQASHRSGASSSAMLSRALHLNLASPRDQTPASAPSSARSATSSRRSRSPSSRGLFPSPLLAAAGDALSDPDVIEHGVGMRIEQRGHGIMCVHDSFLPLSVPSLFLCLPLAPSVVHAKIGYCASRYVASILEGGSAQLCKRIALHDELIKIGVDGGLRDEREGEE